MSGKDSSVSFDDLHLGYGQAVTIVPNKKEPSKKEEGVFIGCIPGESIILTPSDEPLSPISEGQDLLISVTTSEGVGLFSSKVLYISEVPTAMVYLDIPTKIQYKAVRGQSRVSVAIPVLASNVTNAEYTGIAGRISDISLSGAKIRMHEPIGSKGDKVALKGKFGIGEIKKMISVDAVIRADLGHNDGMYAYGVEFFEGDEEKLLILFGFIFSAMSFGKIQRVN